MKQPINLINASIVLLSVEDATSVDRNILMEDAGFKSLYVDLLANHIDMQEATNQLKTFVNNNY